jgi:UDP-glucuronate 4-epimerase
MKVVVTGAAGFIGSHVAEYLLKRGDTVIGIDEVNDYYPVVYKEKNIALLNKYPHFMFHQVDIGDFGALKAVWEDDITHVAHLAARAGVRYSIENPFIYEHSNVKGTLNILELSKNTTNVVITSSSSVYGLSKSIPFKESDPMTDRTISPYAATKKACEVLAHTYHHIYDMNINVVRPFTVYGPRGRPDMVMWIFLENALKGEPIPKFGDGTAQRDYTYIADFVQGFVAALDKPLGYEIFNIGNDDPVELNKVIEWLAQITGKDIKINQLPKQPGDVDRTHADLTKARTMLGYDPKTSVRDGMQQFYDWYRKTFV